MNAVIIVINPINGKRNALTTPISTPTFTITIENSPRGADNAKAERNDLPFSHPKCCSTKEISTKLHCDGNCD